jgi:succinate dehydrogenase/fumarate reductase flavoprotein subunit
MTWDCIVIGSGHAGSSAALSASEHGSKKVLVIDKCPRGWVGGNGYFSAGAHRTVHDGLHDLRPIIGNVAQEATDLIDMDPYTAENFTSDIMRLGSGESDPDLVAAVVDNSRETIGWLASHVGVPFILSFNRQAYMVSGRQKFWGGMVLSVEDGGKGLIAAHQLALEKAGVEVMFDTPAVELILKDHAVCGIVVKRDGQLSRLDAHAVVLAAGGFEANPDLRLKHLGPGWENARVCLLLL